MQPAPWVSLQAQTSGANGRGEGLFTSDWLAALALGGGSKAGGRHGSRLRVLRKDLPAFLVAPAAMTWK
jgi:hypothetical protein